MLKNNASKMRQKQYVKFPLKILQLIKIMTTLRRRKSFLKHISSRDCRLYSK